MRKVKQTWNYKRHPKSRPCGQAMGSVLQVFGENCVCYDDIAVYDIGKGFL